MNTDHDSRSRRRCPEAEQSGINGNIFMIGSEQAANQ
jgi:hypothetical protein